jgi:hypothetical protein
MTPQLPSVVVIVVEAAEAVVVEAAEAVAAGAAEAVAAGAAEAVAAGAEGWPNEGVGLGTAPRGTG